jgi:hypothetical protein
MLVFLLFICSLQLTDTGSLGYKGKYIEVKEQPTYFIWTRFHPIPWGNSHLITITITCEVHLCTYAFMALYDLPGVPEDKKESLLQQ